MRRTGRHLVIVPLPMDGTTRCGERRSMWRDDVTAARTTTREAAEAARRLLGEGEIWPELENTPSASDSCGCCDDD